MRYYEVGVVDYTPRHFSILDYTADYSDPYQVGEVIPIIVSFVSDSYDTGEPYIRQDHKYWMENTIEGLKPGDPVIINWMIGEIYRIEVDSRGVGIFEKGN
jgi:hypothetical protein